MDFKASSRLPEVRAAWLACLLPGPPVARLAPILARHCK